MTSAQAFDYEEDVIKQRFISDGEGRGDDKKIGNFMQDYIAWTATDNPEAGESNETRMFKKQQNEITFQRLMMQMEQIQYLTNKTAETIAVEQTMTKKYKDLQVQVRDQIVIHRGLLVKIKEKSLNEKRLKQQKMECEALILLLKRLPDRKKMEAKCNKISKELEATQSEINEMEAKIAFQKQKLALLIQCSKDLASTLEDGRPLVEDSVTNPSQDIAAQVNSNGIEKMDIDELIVVPNPPPILATPVIVEKIQPVPLTSSGPVIPVTQALMKIVVQPDFARCTHFGYPI